jgi:hypothetical protein
MGRQGEGKLAVVLEGHIEVERCRGLRHWLTKKLLPFGLSRARSLSHTPIARSSSPCKGCVVDNPCLSRAI